MLRVIFQDIDCYTQSGCYSLVSLLNGISDTRHGELSDLTVNTGEEKILFRSQQASLLSCSCAILHRHVAIVTLMAEGERAVNPTGEIGISLSEPLSVFMIKIKSALHIARRNSDSQLCPCCREKNKLI